MTAALTNPNDWPTAEEVVKAMDAKGEIMTVPVMAAVLDTLWALLVKRRAGREESE